MHAGGGRGGGGMYFFCFLKVDEPINGFGGWGLIISRGEL